jgi:hypothetical protein
VAEKPAQPHDQECAEADGTTCVCACRGRFHGVGTRRNRGSRLARMGDVAVTAKNGSTPAARERNPVTVTPTARVAEADAAVTPYDLPIVTHLQHTNQDAPTVPADLTHVADDELARLLTTVEDPAGADRVAAEMDRRDNESAYQQLVASVPDPAGLQGLDEDRLTDLFVQVTSVAGDPDPEAYARLSAEFERRTAAEAASFEHQQALRAFVNRPLGDMSDADLEVAARHAATLGDDSAIERIFTEWDRREQAANTPDEGVGHHRDVDQAKEDRLDELLAAGWDYIEAYADVHNLDADQMRRQEAGQVATGGRAVGGTEKALRKSYDEHTYLQYLDAETWTRGNLLSRTGRAKNIDPATLFSGPMATARAYASEELLRYWAEHPRMTFAEFKGNVTGTARASRERARAGAGGSGKDFAA